MICLYGFSDEFVKIALKKRKLSGETTEDRDFFIKRLEDAEKTQPRGPHPSMHEEVRKIAGAQPSKKPAGKEGLTGQQMAMIGAGAAPFGGLIGQGRMIHDPVINKSIRRMSIEDLSRQAQPGDVMLTTKPKSVWKSVQSPFSGSAMYHAQPIVGRRKGRGLTVSAGNYVSGSPADKYYYRRLGRKDFLWEAPTVGQEMKAEKYTGAVLLRPTKKMTPEQLETFVQQSLDRARTGYDTPAGIRGWLRDLFVPKVGPGSWWNRFRKPTEIQYKRLKDPATGKMVMRPVHCKGNVCATLPAQAMAEATGTSVVHGKSARGVTPADYLRSKAYSPVGAVVGEGQAVSRVRPYLIRGGIGLGLAGATYGATERPDIAGAVGGGVGAAMLAGKVQKHLLLRGGMSAKEVAKVNPNVVTMIDQVLNANNPRKGREALFRYLKRRLPPAILGGAMSYLAIRALQNRRARAAEANQPVAPTAPT